MSAATGLSDLDLEILAACDRLGAGAQAPHVKTSRVLDFVHDRTGIGPRISFEPLCLMARPWLVHLRLIDFRGNVGSPDFGPAAARYTESRLTPLGAAALAAERGATGPLPIGLINGDLHVGGHRPPLDPARVLAALRGAADPRRDLATVVGGPVFPTGCRVAVEDHDALMSGAPTSLTLTARIAFETPTLAVISHLPPDSSSSAIATAIWTLVERHRRGVGGGGDGVDPAGTIVDVNDPSSGGMTRIEVTFAAATDSASVSELLTGLWPISHSVSASFGMPLDALLRPYAEDTRHDLADRLAAIEGAITGV